MSAVAADTSSRPTFTARLNPHARGAMRTFLVLLLLVGCSNAPERTRIEAASVEGDPRGGLKAAIGVAAGSQLVPVLAHGCPLPCSATQAIRPASANQEVIAFRLYQARGAGLADAAPLGTYRVSWARLAQPPREVEITFSAAREGAFLQGKARPSGEPLDITRVDP